MRLNVIFWSLILISFLAAGHSFAACEAQFWQEYKGTKLWKLPGSAAYFYVTKRMAIDADGAPNAYHPEDKGIDALKNAGYPGPGWKGVLVPDPADPLRPFVQAEGEYAGYFLAMTTLEDLALPVTDPRRYVDARTVPYMVFPGDFYRIKGTGRLGDLAAARNLSNGKTSPVVVAEKGPDDAKLGEVSIRLAENLGGSHVNPRTGTGAPSGEFLYVVFPKSRSDPPWPVSAERMEERTKELLADIGGWERVIACMR